MNYGPKMKEIRLKYNKAQKDIAEVLKISPITYSHYETQDSIIPLKHLNNFCNYFKVPIDYIFGLSKISSYDDFKESIDKKQVGNNLKVFRADHKITQEKLAAILNVSKSVVADYERGRYLIATPFLYTICKKYNVSADYLLGKTNNSKII